MTIPIIIVAILVIFGGGFITWQYRTVNKMTKELHENNDNRLKQLSYTIHQNDNPPKTIKAKEYKQKN